MRVDTAAYHRGKMMNIALIGFGNVGQGFVSILHQKASELLEQHGFEGKIVALATGRNGSLYHPGGLDTGQLLNLADDSRRGVLLGRPYTDAYPDTPGLQRGWDAFRIVRESNADVIVEASPSNLQTGQPALDLCYTAFEAGKHVVLANKGPVAVAYRELAARAKSAGKLLRFEGTVMAGTPSIRLVMQALAGCAIKQIRGILNGTTNYILGKMEEGKSYADALAEAQALGYAETDPSGDVEGWDAAGKVLILAAAVFGLSLNMRDLDVTGITGITAEDVTAALSAGERWKLICTITPDGGSVRPERVPMSDPLAGVKGATNAVTYRTDLLGDISLIGAGAGRRETGFALLSDVLEISKAIL